MGFLIKFLLFFTVAYLLMKSFVAFLSGHRGKQSSSSQRQQPPQTKQPETQEDRIIEYQKKNFAESEVEDVEFVEIKNQKQEE
ncbi:MAG: hypothetical protein A2W86_02190 [Bacteroidetes bacterium GWD2_45_23]|jgi:hypothetical protein|nr:MAG: hypothetical protein A2W87_00790 [Bacteroidetes bacterium GWC2_46_850]OFX69174.1 MAG: hypothetical protein A2071_09775 [Bacteroidetes bacterium GWC1_47_7]OFX87232.1 MAG: hypothetical protein A2W86_02190 [Bacteroidetes bacterium GWD2_45_23]HAR39316.1 hypothetical protein [Porphyromonadaceae bacterium]HBB01749.1 hypothetical protein [Porphyromonadaceae bacterium]